MKQLFILFVCISVFHLAYSAGIVGSTQLLTQTYANQIETWLGEGSITLSLLYSKQTGDTAPTFHSAVDGKGRTIVLIQVLNNGNIIGGYNPFSWASSGSYRQTMEGNAFLFNLNQNVKQVQSQVYQTVNLSNYGPTFGGGHDIYVDNSLSSGYTNLHSYSGTYNISYLSTGYNTITVGKIEVFTISAGVVPEPGSLLLLAFAGLILVFKLRK